MLKRILLLSVFALECVSIGIAQQKPLPELSRVGVDVNRQRPLSLRDALSLALENNKDIEVARENVRIAEFDLLGAQGAYDPRLTTQAFYERIKSPISSFLSGGQNGSTTQSDYTGTARLEGQSPVLGGNYRFDFSSVKLNYKQSVRGFESAVSDVAELQLLATAVARTED